MPDHVITLIGLADDSMGVVAWNADGTGPEKVLPTRSFETPLGSITHHMYTASPDYDGIVPGSPGGLRGAAIDVGFLELRAALTAVDARIDDLTVSLPLATEAPGEFHHDEQHLETRTMISDRPTTVRLGDEALVRLPIARWHATIDWGVDRFEDSVHVTRSHPVRPADASMASSPAAKRVAAGLLSDIGSGSLTLTAQGIVIHFDRTFTGNGRRDGICADITDGRLEMSEAPPQ